MQFALFQVQRNLSGLLKLMYDSDVNYKFIKERISRLWPKWLQAFDYNLLRWPKSLQHRRRLNVRASFFLCMSLFSSSAVFCLCSFFFLFFFLV